MGEMHIYRWGKPTYINGGETRIYSHLSKVLVKHPAALTEPPQRHHFASRKLLLLNNNSFCAIENKIGEYQDAVEPISMATRKLK